VHVERLIGDAAGTDSLVYCMSVLPRRIAESGVAIKSAAGKSKGTW
jgi:hypothetical protein